MSGGRVASCSVCSGAGIVPGELARHALCGWCLGSGLEPTAPRSVSVAPVLVLAPAGALVAELESCQGCSACFGAECAEDAEWFEEEPEEETSAERRARRSAEKRAELVAEFRRAERELR